MAITRQVHVTPLVTVQSTAFAKQYELGVWWSMYGDEQGRGPVRDSYFVINLKRCIEHGYFDGQHDRCLPYIGFYLGMYHGGILSPCTGQLRPDVTTLAAITNREFARGYHAGRRAYFTELDPHERLYTETQFLQRLAQHVHEDRDSSNSPDTALTYWVLGDLFGLLSGRVLPQTEKERDKWEANTQLCPQA